MLARRNDSFGVGALDVTELPCVTPAAAPPSASRAPRKSHPRLILVWLATMFALLAASGLFIFRSVNRYAEEAAGIEQTHEVIGVVEATFSSLKDAESTNRGFVISGDPAFGTQSYVAQQNVRDGVERLKSLAADSPTLLRRVEELARKIEEKLEYSNKVVEVRRTEGFESAQRLAMTGRGRAEMGQVRDAAGRIVEYERGVLRERNERAAATGREVVGVIALGACLTCSILFIVYFLIRREGARRLAVERGLEESNARLQQGLVEMERLTADANALNSLGELLQCCVSVSEATDIVGRVIPNILPDTNAGLCLTNPSKNIAQWSALWGEGARHETTFAPHECWALRRGRPHHAREGSPDPACSKLSCAARHGDMCVPLVAHGETLGVIHLGAHAPGALEGRRRTVRAFTDQLALTLANLRLQETLRAQSIRDPLTGLFNRRYMEASLERELTRAARHGSPVGVIMLDVDHFKQFNDAFGHAAGDVVLQELGGLLQANLRGEDIACRYGGEEFILILPGAGPEVAAQRAERIRGAVGTMHPAYHGQQLGRVSASFGVAAFPEHGETLEALIRRADAALYLAKKRGRDRVVTDGEARGAQIMEFEPAAAPV